MLERLIAGWLLGAAIGAAIFFVLRPSASTTGAGQWGRSVAAWFGLIYPLGSMHRTINQGLVNGGAAFIVQIVFGLVACYLLGIVAYWMFRGAKRVTAAVPIVVHTVSQRASGLTAHMNDSMNPYDPSDAANYAQVSEEMKSSPPDAGLWTKALAMAKGDEAAAKANYIKLRVNQLKSLAGTVVSQSLPTAQNTREPLPDNSLIRAASDHPLDENAIYTVVATELDNGCIDAGLWTRLYAECDGDEKKTKVTYIKQRAERLFTDEQKRIEATKLQAERELLLEAEVARKNRLSQELVHKSSEKTGFENFPLLADLNLYARKPDYPKAKFLLGALYLEGRIVTKDVAEAKSLITQAASMGDDLASEALKYLDELVRHEIIYGADTLWHYSSYKYEKLGDALMHARNQ